MTEAIQVRTGTMVPAELEDALPGRRGLGLLLFRRDVLGEARGEGQKVITERVPWAFSEHLRARHVSSGL